MTIFRNPWSWLIAVLALAFAVFLGWNTGYPIALSFVIAVFSIGIASRALHLTRATTRPFLNIKVNLLKWDAVNRVIFAVEAENTGNLPADQVTINCSFYKGTDDDNALCSLELEKPIQSIIFPAETAKTTYLIKSSDRDRLTHIRSRVNVIVNYQNKLTKQQHTTKRMFRMRYASGDTAINEAQAIVIPEEDHWD
jgi:hypothetical protein